MHSVLRKMPKGISPGAEVRRCGLHNIQSFLSMFNPSNILIRDKYSFQSFDILNRYHHSKDPRKIFCDPSSFRPKKALILGKVSRYEFEKMRHRDMNEEELGEVLRDRGSNPELMRKHHQIHEQCQTQLLKSLEKRGLEVKLIQRFDYTDELVSWADVIFTAGGDGTFLMGASKILHPSKPIIGVNTDPTRSAGYLCLPKQLSLDPEEAVNKILTGSFSWALRKRLRITLNGDKNNVWESALELHNQKLKYPEYRYVELMTEQGHEGDHPLKLSNLVSEKDSLDISVKASAPGKRVLPVLALNEVYMGESLSSRVSYLEVKFDEEPNFYKTRNSGICISTGTGSTSWTFNICKLTELSVKQVINLVNEITGSRHQIDSNDTNLVKEVTRRFNNNIVFDSDEKNMAYTIRDPVNIGPNHGDMQKVSRGIVRQMEVKSRCFDACLVIDGGLSYSFNDGTKATIEMFDDDDLRTLVLH